MGDVQASLEMYEAAEIFREVGDLPSLVPVCKNLGDLYQESGQLTRPRPFTSKRRVTENRSGQSWDIARVTPGSGSCSGGGAADKSITPMREDWNLCLSSYLACAT